jgi:uncharacterized protein YjbI with pentapeptide repeats
MESRENNNNSSTSLDSLPLEIFFQLFQYFSWKDFLNFRGTSTSNYITVNQFANQFFYPNYLKKINNTILDFLHKDTYRLVNDIIQLSPEDYRKFMQIFQQSKFYAELKHSKSANKFGTLDSVLLLLTLNETETTKVSNTEAKELENSLMKNKINVSDTLKENLYIIIAFLSLKSARHLPFGTNFTEIYKEIYLALHYRDKDNTHILNLSGLTLVTTPSTNITCKISQKDINIAHYFRKQNLQCTIFENSKIVGHDISEANLSHSIFIKAIINQITFNRAILDHVNFSHAHLSNIKFRNASLQHCNFSSTHLTAIDETDRTDFTLTNCSSTNFSNAIFTNTIRLCKTNFTGAIFIGLKIVPVHDGSFKLLNWRSCTLKKAVFLDPKDFTSGNTLSLALKQLSDNLEIDKLEPEDKLALCCAIARNIVDTFKQSPLDKKPIADILCYLKEDNNSHGILPKLNFLKNAQCSLNVFFNHAENSPRKIINTYLKELNPELKKSLKKI